MGVEVAMYAHGQQLWLVPIRFWEDKEPLPVTRDTTEYGPETLYCFAPHYGHNVILQAKDVFATREEAVAEIARRNAAREAQLDAEVDAIMADILADMGV